MDAHRCAIHLPQAASGRSGVVSISAWGLQLLVIAAWAREKAFGSGTSTIQAPRFSFYQFNPTSGAWWEKGVMNGTTTHF